MKDTKAISMKGNIMIPGDKSISHRAIIFGAIAEGDTKITNFLEGADCISTMECFRDLGISIDHQNGEVLVHGKGLYGLSTPDHPLDVGNSGTTLRLLSGILAAQDFTTTITGDESIVKRPMKRIMDPLTMMGADMISIHHNDCAPLLIKGKRMFGIHYLSHVASAQVKSAILLAGLYANEPTSITEPSLSRNHTEIMLKHFGAHVTSNGVTATIHPGQKLIGCEINVPGDISSAAYFIAAGLLVPNSELLIQNVGVNPTRDGLIHVCKQMGGNVTLVNKRTSGGEPIADILVKSSSLNGTTIEGDIIPTLIDEIPVIALMACMAKGTTIIKDAAELKVKESNRIDTMVENLSALGADITATEDGMMIKGPTPLHGATIDSKMDHRIAMTFAVANLICHGNITIKGKDCVNISYPSFYEELERLIQSV
ncbi:MAG TPA: 3-phosphoshikimate 1-carboxyvinyltransferase [Candidatus Merdenecus merdavium]|nr:3-phosphoshikimate 1-carboxyvinyltransferase [Candidatus Merdenecus merdavium]